MIQLLKNIKMSLIVAELDAGDYADPWGRWCIERKTGEDLVGTIMKKKFLPQLYKMNGYKFKYLMISGDIYGGYDDPRIHSQVRYNITRAVADMQFSVMTMPTDKDLAYFIHGIAYHHRNEKPFLQQESRIGKPISRKIPEKVRLVMGLDNMGKKKARKLLLCFPTIAHLAKATIQEIAWCLAPATGKSKQAKFIYHAFHK